MNWEERRKMSNEKLLSRLGQELEGIIKVKNRWNGSVSVGKMGSVDIEIM